jgi:hypothetical protein
MQSHKLSLKFFADDASAVGALPAHAFLNVFHSWIQRQALPDHLLIDVADYQHVHHGPGIVLVSHEANLYTDTGEGRLGLLYQRKQPLPGTARLRDRLAQVFAAALRACAKLEDDPALRGRLRFRTDEVVFRINDRLLAPNTPETYREVEPELRAFLAQLYPGDEVELEPRHSPLSLFEVRIRVPAAAPAGELLERLEALLPMPVPS